MGRRPRHSFWRRTGENARRVSGRSRRERNEDGEASTSTFTIPLFVTMNHTAAANSGNSVPQRPIAVRGLRLAIRSSGSTLRETRNDISSVTATSAEGMSRLVRHSSASATMSESEARCLSSPATSIADSWRSSGFFDNIFSNSARRSPGTSFLSVAISSGGLCNTASTRCGIASDRSPQGVRPVSS